MSKNETLTPKMVKAVIALLESRDIQSVCQKVGISRATLDRWMSLEAFKEVLQKAESEALANAGRSLLAGQEIALSRLFQIMTDPNPESINTTRKACMDWLDLLFKYRDAIELEKRLDDIEAGIKEIEANNAQKH